MDSVVGFHLQENEQQELHLIPQTQSSTFSVQAARHDHRTQPPFLCPLARLAKDCQDSKEFPLTSSYEYVPSTTRTQQDETLANHLVLPLFWCNNKIFDYTGGCDVCYCSNFGTDYYLCESCGSKYHKECVESPLKIKNPYHPHHPLQLLFTLTSYHVCVCCGLTVHRLLYCCFICNIFMHPICAMQPIPFLIEKPKRHHHPLSFFTRKNSLACNVCGLLREDCLTYVCVRCDFVAHKDCVSFPSIIKISRHHHRISHTSSLLSKEYSCGVCRQSIDGDYGAYTCGKCSDYAVHSRCALQRDVCDGEELEGVPDEDYTKEDVDPFKIISEGVILHFLHDHHLFLEVNMLYDEKKFCRACILPIYEGNFYSCKKCDFILHESCVNPPCVIQHGTHAHPLKLKAAGRTTYTNYFIPCGACHRYCDGFCYVCSVNECQFELDVRCASISEPFEFEGHEHALFLALNPENRPICQVCKERCIQPLNCIKCDFIVCFKCASLPYKVRYKHDEHLLSFSWGEEACEVCECNIKVTNKAFYSCKVCCTFLHNECLLGSEPYLKPGNPRKDL